MSGRPDKPSGEEAGRSADRETADVELKIPPLRERTKDVLALARVVLAEQAERLGRKVTGFSPEARLQERYLKFRRMGRFADESA